MIRRLAARDALMYWMRERLPNDQFLLYAFDGAVVDRADVLRRAVVVDALTLRIRDVPGNVDYPVWARREPTIDDVVEHSADTWPECRDAIAALLGSVLDPRESPWRLHLFTGIPGVPHCESAAAVVVLQLSHALADGRGAAAIARALFGAPPAASNPPAPEPTDTDLILHAAVRTPALVARMLRRSVAAARAYRAEQALIAAGTLARANPGFELTTFNSADRHHDARIVVTTASALRANGATVTVGALTAISEAMRQFVPGVRIGAEVTVAQPLTPGQNNNFTNVGVELHTDEPDLAQRAAKIAAALRQRRVRAGHETVLAQGLAARVTPAPLVRYGVSVADLTTRPARVAGNTVVTSVNRGPADLTLGGGQVRFTAGFPALSPVMGVTHGVYTIGETVTISVHSSRAALPDPDRYATCLATAVAALS